MAGKNSVNQCSVGQHVNSPCYSSRFVPEDFILSTSDDLEEDTRKTVQFKTNMKSVPSICLHHKITYTNRFRVFLLDKKSNKCSSPLGIHLQKKRPNVSCSKTIRGDRGYVGHEAMLDRAIKIC
jgi:hypothetical protein